MGQIFDAKYGDRLNITTGLAQIGSPDSEEFEFFQNNVTYEVTATNEYKTVKGVRRRLFVDCTTSNFDEIWLSDSEDCGDDYGSINV